MDSFYLIEIVLRKKLSENLGFFGIINSRAKPFDCLPVCGTQLRIKFST